MDRDEFAEWVNTGCALLTYTRKHAHKVAAKGRPVFDDDGKPCIEVVTRVPVEYLSGVRHVGFTHVGAAGSNAPAHVHWIHPDEYSDTVSCALIEQYMAHAAEMCGDPGEDYKHPYYALLHRLLGVDDWPPPGTRDADKVTCPACLRRLRVHEKEADMPYSSSSALTTGLLPAHVMQTK